MRITTEISVQTHASKAIKITLLDDKWSFANIVVHLDRFHAEITRLDCKQSTILNKVKSQRIVINSCKKLKN